ncbi:hypothetical protein APSETT444_002170 [Aspergillus pseudonomiae]
MSQILRFRSTWGVDTGDNYENWRKWLPTLKDQGYGPKPVGLTPTDHLTNYRAQLEIAKTLKPFKINAHSGEVRDGIDHEDSDGWSIDQSVEFFTGTLAIDAELGLAGMLNTQGKSANNDPSLQVTADFSHFVVVCERLLDQGEEDKELLRTIIPRVTHIHARIGTTQSSQCPDPTNDVFTEERRFFENSWKQIIQSIVRQTSSPVTFVPEYGYAFFFLSRHFVCVANVFADV